jgi:hypothetical protein
MDFALVEDATMRLKKSFVSRGQTRPDHGYETLTSKGHLIISGMRPWSRPLAISQHGN